MKNIFLSLIAMLFFLAACNSNSEKSSQTDKSVSGTSEESTHEHGSGMETVPDSSNTGPAVSVTGFSIEPLVKNYLKIKNALTKDDAKAAAIAGDAMVADFANLDVNALSAAEKKIFTDVADDAKEHAEHIGSNAAKIEHQREHFSILSKDVNDLVKTFAAGQKLYQDFCPMYNDGKGAVWLSENKEIKNPYYGSKMLSCGTVKKEL